MKEGVLLFLEKKDGKLWRRLNTSSLYCYVVIFCLPGAYRMSSTFWFGFNLTAAAWCVGWGVWERQVKLNKTAIIHWFQEKDCGWGSGWLLEMSLAPDDRVGVSRWESITPVVASTGFIIPGDTNQDVGTELMFKDCSYDLATGWSTPHTHLILMWDWPQRA